jgi:hypothetical protein
MEPTWAAVRRITKLVTLNVQTADYPNFKLTMNNLTTTCRIELRRAQN